MSGASTALEAIPARGGCSGSCTGCCHRSPEPKALSSHERFLRACYSEALDHPPVWLMRQAGRCLPEYRALKEKHSFLELVQTPELAAEVTLQPIQRFGFDAAILFSDILVVPEALGQGYHFREQGGIQMAFEVRSARDIAALQPEALPDRLQYVSQALKLIKDALKGRTALLGFAGSPWTLANFMMEGGSAREFTAARKLFYSDRALFDVLSARLTSAVTLFLQMQIDAGVDAIQIFDSLGGLLPVDAFEAASAQWMREIITSLRGQVPVIVFSKGTHSNWDTLVETGAHVIGMDWMAPLPQIAARLPEGVGFQGNLDPLLLTTTPELVRLQTERLLEQLRGRKGHIFNLGHGVPPNARLENISAVVDTVRSFK